MLSETTEGKLIVGILLVVAGAMAATTHCLAQELCTTKDCNDLQIEKLKDLPASILAFLNAASGGGIADKSEPYNVGDAVSGKLPCRRFKNAAVGSQRAVVRMEVGCSYGGPRLQWFWFTKAGDSWAFTGDNP